MCLRYRLDRYINCCCQDYEFNGTNWSSAPSHGFEIHSGVYQSMQGNSQSTVLYAGAGGAWYSNTSVQGWEYNGTNWSRTTDIPASMAGTSTSGGSDGAVIAGNFNGFSQAATSYEYNAGPYGCFLGTVTI